MADLSVLAQFYEVIVASAIFGIDEHKLYLNFFLFLSYYLNQDSAFVPAINMMPVHFTGL